MINYIISNKKLNIEYISYIGKNNQIYKKNHRCYETTI